MKKRSTINTPYNTSSEVHFLLILCMTFPKNLRLFIAAVAIILFANFANKEFTLVCKGNILQNILVFIYRIFHCFAKFNSPAFYILYQCNLFSCIAVLTVCREFPTWRAPIRCFIEGFAIKVPKPLIWVFFEHRNQFHKI